MTKPYQQEATTENHSINPPYQHFPQDPPENTLGVAVVQTADQGAIELTPRPSVDDPTDRPFRDDSDDDSDPSPPTTNSHDGTANPELPSLPAESLLAPLWRSPDLHHQIGLKDEGGRTFCHLPAHNVGTALTHARTKSAAKSNVYFACAEYNNTATRTAANAACANAFWVDIDCSVEKAVAGKGYEDTTRADSALRDFCKRTHLPPPTHIVESGGGLHVYWVFDRPIARGGWQEHATWLKALTKAHGLLADPTRTGDIASVLRIPGTLNYKYDPPRPVRLVRADAQLIDRDTLLRAIRAAHDRLPESQALSTSTSTAAPDGVARAGTTGTLTHGAPDLARLASALKPLDPDCEDEKWKLRRLAPMARAAREHPELADKLKALAKSWSSGELREVPSRAWVTPGASNGITGEAEFGKSWSRFTRADYSGQPATLGTIYHDAAQVGWRDPDAFQAIAAPEPGHSPQEAEDRARATMEALVSRVKAGDVGAPLEADNVAMLTLLARDDPAEFQRVRDRLKMANNRVSLAAIDAAVKVQRAEYDVAQTHHGYAMDALTRLTIGGWPPVGHAGALYVVDPETNIWLPKEQGHVAKLIAETHDGGDNCKRLSDYKGIAEYATSCAGDESFFTAAPVGLACTAGFYQIVGDVSQLVPLTPAHRQRVRVDYSPSEQSTPLFDAFLHDTFQSEREGEEVGQIALLQELAGAIMVGLMPRHHKAFFFYDPIGRAGKGTTVSILSALLPRRFVVAVSPMYWDKEYYTVQLADARLNVVGELPDDKSIPAAQFKTVIGGDLVTGRHPAGRPISFKNEAAHVFSSNHLINSHDHSEAFFGRWVIVDFPNSRSRLGLPLDPNLADRIIENELAGIANWGLAGAARLLRNNGFTKSATHDRIMQKWRRSNSSLDEFIYEDCELESGHSVRRAELYYRYKEWCGENGRKAFSKARVKELLEHNVGLGITLASLHGYDIFRGVKLNATPEADGCFTLNT